MLTLPKKMKHYTLHKNEGSHGQHSSHDAKFKAVSAVSLVSSTGKEAFLAPPPPPFATSCVRGGGHNFIVDSFSSSDANCSATTLNLK